MDRVLEIPCRRLYKMSTQVELGEYVRASRGINSTEVCADVSWGDLHRLCIPPLPLF